MSGDRLFASYAGEDRARVLATVEALKRRGLDVWWDRHEMGPSDDVVAEIDSGLKSSKHFILFASTSYFAKRWTNAEYFAAVAMAMAESGRLLFIVRLDDTPLPPLLASRLFIVWTDAETVADQIAASLNRIGAGPKAATLTSREAAKTMNWHDAGDVPDYLVDVLVERLLETVGDLRDPRVPGPTIPVNVPIADELTLTLHVSNILIKNEDIIAELRNTRLMVSRLSRRAQGLASELTIDALGHFKVSYEMRLEEVQTELSECRSRLRSQMSALSPRLTKN